jgi:hypothetical protein
MLSTLEMRMTMARRMASICAAAVLAFALAACGGSMTAGATTSTPGSSGSAARTSVPSSSGATAKVSANTTSGSDIAAALESAGVSNADRWAQEVVEYRPYSSNDPNLGKLHKNLAKYNPDQETVDKIVSALTP